MISSATGAASSCATYLATGSAHAHASATRIAAAGKVTRGMRSIAIARYPAASVESCTDRAKSGIAAHVRDAASALAWLWFAAI